MSAKDLIRRRILAFVVGVSTATTAIGTVHAELVLNFPIKGDTKLSKEASATLLYGAYQILGAIQQGEIDRDKAQGTLKGGVALVEKARGMFMSVQKLAGSAVLNPEKVKLRREAVARIQAMHKIVIPKTMSELSQLAISEVDQFLGATKEMGFENLQKARSTTLTFSAAINRLLDVGVLVSELSETAESK